MSVGIITHVAKENVYMYTIFNNKGIIIPINRKQLSKTVNEKIKIGDEVSYEETSESNSRTLEITNLTITREEVHKIYIETVLSKLKSLNNLIYMPLSHVLKIALDNAKEIEPNAILEIGLPKLGLKPIGVAHYLLNNKKIYEPIIVFEEIEVRL